MTIATEQDFFNANVSSWLSEHRGEYALVFGEKVQGFFPSSKAGFEAGVERFGMDSDFVVALVCEPAEAMSGLVTWDFGLLAAV